MAFSLFGRAEKKEVATPSAPTTPYRLHPTIESQYKKEEAIVLAKYRARKWGPWIGVAVVLLIGGLTALYFVQRANSARDDDGDGVPNLTDRCPGADDGIDRDSNGIPDGCDTLPPPNGFATLTLSPTTILPRSEGDARRDVFVTVTNQETEWHLTSGRLRFTSGEQTIDVPFFVNAEASRPVMALAQTLTNPTTVTATVIEGLWKRRNVPPILRLPLTSVQTFNQDGHSITDAIVKNDSTVPIHEFLVVATARDAKGTIIALNQSVVTDLPSSTSRLVHYSWAMELPQGTEVNVAPFVDLGLDRNFVEPSAPPVTE